MSMNNSNVKMEMGDLAYQLGEVNPLRDGAEVSWIPRCMVGDNQGQDGACTLFALANWCEVMSGEKISDKECIDAWKRARLRLHGNLNGGLSIPDAWYAAHKAGWFRADQAPHRVRDLQTLGEAPLVACYRITEGWSNTNDAGCIDHADTTEVGNHAVLLVAHGILASANDIPMVWIENSWGKSWGHKGLGCMIEMYHKQYVRELWRIPV